MFPCDKLQAPHLGLHAVIGGEEALVDHDLG